jgi:hypothetical protein
LDKFKGLPFWIWDQEKHENEFDRILTQSFSKIGSEKVACCFNHLVGLPVKNSISHPIYLWQQELLNALQSHKLIAILKGRGVGASEFLLRYIMWLCLKDDQLQGKSVIVVTGIREDLSLELLRRYRNLLPDYNWNGPSNMATINQCRLIGFPSKRVKDMRGLTDVVFCVVDEFAFFDPADKQQVLPILEALQAKSNPTICLLSTPGPIGDEFHSIFQEPANRCRYHRLYIPIQKALSTLISKQEAEKVRRQGNYAQEFELRFGSYGVGTVFSLSDIDRAVEMGKELQEEGEDYIDLKNGQTYSIGADPGGWGHSKFGIVMVGLLNNKLRVLAAEEHAQVDEDEMIKRLLYLRSKTPHPRQTKIYIDSANVSFIKRLKSCIPDERIDYQEFLDNLRKRKLVTPPSESQTVHFMSVIPVSFAKQGPHLLANLYAFMQRGDIVISPRFTTLIAALQSARHIPNRSNNFLLDKTSQSLDCLDAMRLALFNFDAGGPTFEEEEEEEEEEEGEKEENNVVLST